MKLRSNTQFSQAFKSDNFFSALEMTRRGLDIPLFIGGATTSALHTAVKLAPLYSHVFYAQDASTSAVMAKKCLMNREKFEAEEHAAQERIRSLYESRPHTDAESAGPAAFPEYSYLKAEEYDFQDIPAMELGIDQVMPHFDWRMFLAIWGFKYGLELPDDPEINKILAEGKTVLERFRTRHEVLIRLSFKSMLARRKGNDIDAKYGSGGNEVNVVFPMMRQEKAGKSVDGRPVRLSLADFVPEKSYGPMGVFAVSVQTCHTGCCTCGCFESMLDRAVRVTLAEAASIWLDKHLEEHLHPEAQRKFRVNVKSRLIKLVLLPLWYGNKDIIRDTLS